MAKLLAVPVKANFRTASVVAFQPAVPLFRARYVPSVKGATNPQIHKAPNQQVNN